MWFIGSGRDEKDAGDFKKIIFNMWFGGSGKEGGDSKIQKTSKTHTPTKPLEP